MGWLHPYAFSNARLSKDGALRCDVATLDAQSPPAAAAAAAVIVDPQTARSGVDVEGRITRRGAAMPGTA